MVARSKRRSRTSRRATRRSNRNSNRRQSGGRRRFRAAEQLPPIRITLIKQNKPPRQLTETETFTDNPKILLGAQLEYLTATNSYVQEPPDEIITQKRLYSNFDSQQTALETIVLRPKEMTRSLEYQRTPTDPWQVLKLPKQIDYPGAYRVRVHTPWTSGQRNGFIDFYSPIVTFVSPPLTKMF